MCVDKAYVEITHFRPMQGLIEEQVFAVQDRFLQRSFNHIIIEWGACFPQQQSQRLPVPQQTPDGFAQS